MLEMELISNLHHLQKQCKYYRFNRKVAKNSYRERSWKQL